MKTFKNLAQLVFRLGVLAMVYADEFWTLALLFCGGLWIATQFYRAKGASLTSMVLLALVLAAVAPATGGILTPGSGGADLLTMGAIAVMVLWAAQGLFRVSLAQAAAYVALAWVVGASVLHAF